MTFEGFFATFVVFVGVLLLTGIIFYFKGHRDGMRGTVDDFLKKESEGTDSAGLTAATNEISNMPAEDVVEEIFAEIEKCLPITKLVIKDVGEFDFHKYGEKFYWVSEAKLAELKNKYEEKGK